MGGDLGLACGDGELAGLVNRVGKRLFAIDVLAHLERHHRDWRMQAVRGGHHHAVDVLFGLQQPPEVAVRLGVGETLVGPSRSFIIHVAERNVVVIGESAGETRALPAESDEGEIELFAGRHLSGPAQHVARHKAERRSPRGRSAHKSPP